MLPLVLAGCTTFEDFFNPPPRQYEPDAAVPVAERPVEEPIARNYFVLETPGQSVVGAPQVVYTQDDNTLSDLAREYGLGYDEILSANPDLDPWLPGTGMPVLLPTQYVIPDVERAGLVLNIASKRLFYFPAVAEGEPQPVMTYPIGIGRVGWETPLGASEVISKAVNPHWYVPWSVQQEHAENGNPLPSVVPPGPDNPLGTRVLKLDMPGYLIHGTNQPYGVGMRVSHGCVRLYPENIELLYELVEVGEPVMIINEPYLLGRRDGELFFESHEPLEDDTIAPAERLDQLLATYREKDALSRSDAEHIRAIASIADGVPVKVSARDSSEVFARAKLVRNTAEPDPDAPTLGEVREMIDEVMAEEALDAISEEEREL